MDYIHINKSKLQSISFCNVKHR